MDIFAGTSIGALSQTANFAQRRHELLAGNLANMDTPGYRTRDLDVEQFQSALSEAIDAQRSPPEYSSPASSVRPRSRSDAIEGPRLASETIVYHDDSDVSLEHQITEIAKNQHLHSLAITTMRSQFALLQAAITERA